MKQSRNDLDVNTLCCLLKTHLYKKTTKKLAEFFFSKLSDKFRYVKPLLIAAVHVADHRAKNGIEAYFVSGKLWLFMAL